MAEGERNGRPTTDGSLAAAFRATASGASRCVGDGFSLVFIGTSSSAAAAPRLVAAAGFPTPDAARKVAERLGPELGEAVEPGRSGSAATDALGDDGQISVWPLHFAERTHGALVVGTRGPLADAARAALEPLAEALALRLDHAWLAERCARTEHELGKKLQSAEQKSEEILQLSEALFAQDIELLRSQEKLGTVEKLKNDFIEKMSRELRIPLNSIIEAIIQVLAGENENLSEAAQQSLRRALDEGTSFQRTLHNILDLWRIKQGEMPVEIHEVNFREVVEEAIFSVQDTLGDKPVKIEKRLIQPFPKLRADLAKVNQILFLLLDNAAKFTERGEIQIEAQVEDGWLHCQVRDTGIGVCADDREYVFDEFYQVDALSSTRYRGAGLGLTLVRDLVTLLGGELSLRSEVGVGTTVAFRVPVEPVR